MDTINISGIFSVEHRNAQGDLLNQFTCRNKISDLAKLDVLDVMLGTNTAPSAWYVGLMDGVFDSFTNGGAAATPYTNEFTDYDETARPQIDTLFSVAASGGGYASIENPVATAPATFTISTGVSAQDLNGIVIMDNSTKGGAETTYWWCTAAFGNNDSTPAPITVNAGDTVKVGYKCQIAI